MSGLWQRRSWSKVRVGINSLAANAHRFLFVGLIGVLSYAVYHVVLASQAGALAASELISFAALIASTYSVWYTHWLPPNISIKLAWDRGTRSEYEKLGLLFYNSGTSSTYMRIEAITCGDKRLEVLPTYIPERRVEAKGMELVHVSLRSTEPSTVLQDIVLLELKVSYRFWRGQQKVYREKMIAVKFDERSDSNA